MHSQQFKKIVNSVKGGKLHKLIYLCNTSPYNQTVSHLFFKFLTIKLVQK